MSDRHSKGGGSISSHLMMNNSLQYNNTHGTHILADHDKNTNPQGGPGPQNGDLIIRSGILGKEITPRCVKEKFLMEDSRTKESALSTRAV